MARGDAADVLVADLEHRVRAGAHVRRFGGPAQQTLIEGQHGSRIGRHQVVPDEVAFAHDASFQRNPSRRAGLRCGLHDSTYVRSVKVLHRFFTVLPVWLNPTWQTCPGL